MTCNTGKMERALRVVAGLAILSWGWWAGSWWGALGLVPLMTGATGFCPAYLLAKAKSRSARN